MSLTKTSAMLLAGATIVAADFRPIANRGAVVPGSFYLRVGSPAQAAKLQAIDPRVQVFPSMNGGFARLNVTVDTTQGTISGPDFPVLVKLINAATYVEEDVWMFSPRFVTQQPANPTEIKVWPGTDNGLQSNDYYTGANWAKKALSPASSTYPGFGRNGEGVDVYVIGNGINVNHPQFEGRASHLYPKGADSSDETGVSTLEAGIIASKDFGVAPKANILSVKVPLDPNTKMSRATDFYAAADAILTKVQNTDRPAVVYTGLVGQSDSGSTTNIFRFLINNAPAGKVHGSATGQSWSDSCKMLGGGLSYGADYFMTGAAMPNGKILNRNAQANGDVEVMSPYGGCVHLSAPGFNLKSTSKDGASAYISGQNAAAAVTAGLLAGFRSAYPAYTQAEVKTAILTGVQNIDADINAGGMMFSHNSPRVFDLKNACRSYAPHIKDDFCRAAECSADYKTMCEINAKEKPSKVCMSIMKNIPDSWCAATGCPSDYSSICQWKCNA